MMVNTAGVFLADDLNILCRSRVDSHAFPRHNHVLFSLLVATSLIMLS